MICQQDHSAHPASSHLSLIYKGYFQGLQGVFLCSGIGLTTSHTVDICSSTVLHGLMQDNLLRCVLPHCLWGNLFSGAWSTPSSAPSQTLTFSLLFLPFLPPSHCSLSGIFPFLLFSEAPHTWLMGSIVSCSGCFVDPAGNNCVWHRVAPGLTEITLQPTCC